MRRIVAGFALTLYVVLAATDIAHAKSIPASLGVTASKPSPQRLSTAGTVVFTATATGGSGSYEYQFFLKTGAGPYVPAGDAGTGYSADDTWSWTPTAAAGYSVRVYARNQGSGAIYERQAFLAYSILVDPPTTGVTLIPDKNSPQPAMTTVIFTAQASGGTGTYAYRFYVAQGSGAYVAVENGGTTGYSSLNQFSWTPSKPATYKIMVYAKNTASLASYQSARNISYPITGVLCPDGNAVVGFAPDGRVICDAVLGPAGPKGDKGDPGETGSAGEPGTTILAYDDNQQLLGTAVTSLKQGDQQNHYLTLIVPSVPGFVPIDEIDGTVPSLSMYWDGLDCTGTAYAMTNLSVFSCYSTRFCTGNAPIVTMALKSFSYTADPAACQNADIQPAPRYTVKEVQLPFSVPVAVPMRIEM